MDTPGRVVSKVDVVQWADEEGSEVLNPALARNQDLGQTYGDPEADGTTQFGGNVSVTWDELEQLPADPEVLSALLRDPPRRRRAASARSHQARP